MNEKRAKRLRQMTRAKLGGVFPTQYEDQQFPRFMRVPPRFPGAIEHAKFGWIIPYQVYTRKIVGGSRYAYRKAKTEFKRLGNISIS